VKTKKWGLAKSKKQNKNKIVIFLTRKIICEPLPVL